MLRKPRLPAPRGRKGKKKPALLLAALVICFIGVMVMLGRLAGGGRNAAPPPAPADESLGEPLIAPFYPTFDTLSRLNGLDDLKRYLYGVDDTAYVAEGDLDVRALAGADLTTDLSGPEPKILVFHTHSREAFADSRPGALEDTIVGVGQKLCEILVDKYHISVVHDVGQYDVVNGEERRDGSYERMAPAVEALLRKYPSIEVVVDLHRDGVPDGARLVATVGGAQTARLMLFDGILSLNDNGSREKPEGLDNPYLRDNLAMSLQMQLVANELYPGLMRRIYLKPYRYSLFMKPKSILVEVGAQTSTVQEAKNAMGPLAEILTGTLSGKYRRG
ncbi:MAG: stage II sporulation protein P [Firmicutes bacterium]|nr:stage II sporulation protein P [Bacillota bacterium]